MDSMIEKVARAIAKASQERAYGLYDYSMYEGKASPHQVWDERVRERILATEDKEEARNLYEKLTREYVAISAIQAMREPTEEMLEMIHGDEEIVTAYQDMIDAALNEG